MTKIRNTLFLPKMIFGRGTLQELESSLAPHRKNPNSPFVYIMDHYFKKNEELTHSLPLSKNDLILYADTTLEPNTKQVDSIRNRLRSAFGNNVSGIVGIGGGSVMDIAKALALMLTNKGSSASYQGRNLIKNPAVYKIGVPTLSGTGSEVSRTCILTGPEKKMGISSDHTPFNQIILDPNLIADVSNKQRFFTGMDCYLQCLINLRGNQNNTLSRTYGEKALALCRELFLNPNDWSTEHDEKLMMASYFGGITTITSQTGILHALSCGLSFMTGIKQSISNCLVMCHLENYYPEECDEFQRVLKSNNIVLPKDVCEALNDKEVDVMINIAMSFEPLWENTVENNQVKKINPDMFKKIYRQI